MPPREHDLHNALFALDDVTERLDAVMSSLSELGSAMDTLHGYLERLLL